MQFSVVNYKGIDDSSLGDDSRLVSAQTGRTFYGHRLIFALASPYWMTMFATAGMAEASSATANLAADEHQRLEALVGLEALTDSECALVLDVVA